MCLAFEKSEKDQEGSPCLKTSKGKFVQNWESQSIYKSIDTAANCSNTKAKKGRLNLAAKGCS